MTENQLKEIRTHLLSKKLPIDILLEVQDHFVSQILELQREENRDFESAFSQVKKCWCKELQPYWKGGLNLEEVSDFMRTMRLQIERSNVLQAMKGTLASLLILLVSYTILEIKHFVWFSFLFVFSLVSYAYIRYWLHRNEFRIAEKYPTYILTLHQHSPAVFLSMFSLVGSLAAQLPTSTEYFQNFEAFRNDNGRGIWTISVYVFCISSVFYSLRAQKNYLRQLKKVKPFLQFL